MTNTLRSLVIAGALGLAVAGCVKFAKIETYNGMVDGNNVEVTRQKSDTLKRTVRIKANPFLDLNSPHYIVARDVDGDGAFEEIVLDGVDIEKIRPISSPYKNVPLYDIANSEPLNRIYNEALGQNQGGKK